MKRRIVPIVITLVSVVVFWLLFSYGYVEVRLGRTGDGTTVAITSQSDNETSEINPTSEVVRRLVRRGNHEVLVRQGDMSYFAIVKSEGFLSTASVTSNLSKEKARSFIGNNPSPCMQVISGVLLSSACGDRIDQLQVHVPATASQPTFSRKSPSPFNGFMEGIVQTAEGTIVVIKAPLVDEDEGPPHGAYLLDANGNVSNGVALEALNENATYKITKYQDGFLAYSSAASQAHYYQSMHAQPTTINLAKPKNTSLHLQTIDTRGEMLAITYSNSTVLASDLHETGEVHSDVITRPETKPKSEMVFQEKSTAKHYSFDLAPHNIRICAASQLCLLDDGVLEILDVTGEKQKSLFRIYRVTAFRSIGTKLLVVRTNEILGIDPVKQTGSIEYSLANYTYCGIHASDESYVVCVNNSNNRRIALLINRGIDNVDSIDKKIANLLQSSDVKDVSAYGKFIHISPNVGEVRPNPQTGFFEYDRNLVSQVNGRISQKINELGINRDTYTIVNTVN